MILPSLWSVPKGFPLGRKVRKELQGKWANQKVKFVNKQLPSCMQQLIKSMNARERLCNTSALKYTEGTLKDLNLFYS